MRFRRRDDADYGARATSPAWGDLELAGGAWRRAAAARYRELLAWVGKPGKNVYYINQGIYNVLAGKTPYTAVGRDCWHNGQIDRSLYPAAFREAFGKDPFDIVIIDIPTEINSWFLYERLQANYVPVAEMPAITQLPAGVTLRNRKLIFYRKDQVPQPSVPPG